jgi:hypothetical protein
MIVDLILDLILSVPIALLEALPDINLEISANVFDGIETFFANVAYALPVVQLLPILIISNALMLFRVAWAIVIRVKSFIPTMGA